MGKRLRRKIDIINEIEKNDAEIERLSKIASIGEHEGLELAMEEQTNNCVQCVKSKNYKESKDRIKSLEVLHNFQGYLNDQKERIESLKARRAECQEELTKVQLGFELGEIENRSNDDKPKE